jgi:hypothetical protein
MLLIGRLRMAALLSVLLMLPLPAPGCCCSPPRMLCDSIAACVGTLCCQGTAAVQPAARAWVLGSGSRPGLYFGDGSVVSKTVATPRLVL